MLNSDEKEFNGESVPDVSITDHTPWPANSVMAWPGLKHQYPRVRTENNNHKQIKHSI